MFSQTKAKKNISVKDAILLSESYKERARWFKDMPQYNPDSSKYYIARSMKVLTDDEPLHHNILARLKFDRIKNNYKNLSLSGEDSIANTEWANYKNSAVSVVENRVLQYDFLVYWANIKLQKGEPEESLKLFEKALLLINKKDPPNVQAKMTLDKGLYYGLYGLDSEKKISLKYLLESLKYYKTVYKKYPSEFYMINAELEYYYTNKNKDSVKYYLNEVKLILNYLKKPTCHIWYYSTAGSNLIEEGKYEEARSNILEALRIMDTYSGKGNAFYPYCLERLAEIDSAKKNYDAAITNYSKARAEYLKINDYYGALNALKNIGDTYQKKGDLGNALKFKDQYYTESLASEKDLNKRSLRESELKVAVLTQEKELVKKSNQQIFYWIALGISTVILLLVYRNVRLKQKSNLKLASFNKELESKNVQLDKRNAEIEILMKEIHHRVKNNLEVVSSLLALQSAQIDDLNTKEAMLEGQNRVNSIGIVHQKLYQGTNLGAVDMKDYVLDLSESILDSFGAAERVDLQLAIINLNLDIDTAVPLGLIINELLTNTIKYAFPKGETGTIIITLEKQPNYMLHLKVADNGVGKSGITHGTGFGGQLISLLTNQLNGTMREENQNGAVVIFDFKLKKSA
jgi:two-component sensor histidine kinase